MSLKAKIEAVIYAAEEPVTLAQLAFLFGGEVLAGAEVAAAEAEEPVERMHHDLAFDGSSSVVEEATQDQPPASDETLEAEPGPSGEAAAPSGDASSESSNAGAAAGANAVDEKKAARLRERTIRDGLNSIVGELIEEYASGDRGIEIREIAGGYRVSTKPEYHDAVRSFVKSLKPPMKLTKQALETLAVIVYKQPVTGPEISEIRGVDSGGVLGNLMTRKLITTAGRKQVIGRPILYKTTKEFLLRFGLRDVNELPSIEEFAKMAGEMDAEEEVVSDGVARSAALPFDDAGAEAPVSRGGSADEFNAVEANAGEPGVAVSIPTDSASAETAVAAAARQSAEVATPRPIELDSHLAEEVDTEGNHAPELITAVHPSTTVGGE